jgi:murein DD-endopeptidase MepM/ murein hydrolase activator NlpD
VGRILPLIGCAALAACAAPRAEKVSFSEVMPPPPPAAKPAGKKARSGPPEASTSLELESALASFSAKARHFRGEVPPGSRMPLEELENWRRLVAALDAFLARAPEDTSSFDVVRARITAEAELELDARAYGDFPDEIAEGVVDRATRLGVRMAALRRLHVRTREPSRTDFGWPIDPVTVTSLFGRRLHPITRRYAEHLGVDLAAETGQLISAAGRGTVIKAEWSGGYGMEVEIQHPGNVLTRYAHLSQALVEVGTVVDKGDPVGLAGNTGLSTGPHLHFELWRNGRPMDPLDELGIILLKPMASLY